MSDGDHFAGPLEDSSDVLLNFWHHAMSQLANAALDQRHAEVWDPLAPASLEQGWGGDGRELMDHNSTTVVVSDGPPGQTLDSEYDRFVADVWVCVALTLMILSCIGLLCSCMLYHKLQQWKRHAERNTSSSGDGDADSLPSYTLVTGLPTYEQALARMEEGKKSPPERAPGPAHDNKPTKV